MSEKKMGAHVQDASVTQAAAGFNGFGGGKQAADAFNDIESKGGQAPGKKNKSDAIDDVGSSSSESPCFGQQPNKGKKSTGSATAEIIDDEDDFAQLDSSDADSMNSFQEDGQQYPAQAISNGGSSSQVDSDSGVSGPGSHCSSPGDSYSDGPSCTSSHDPSSSYGSYGGEEAEPSEKFSSSTPSSSPSITSSFKSSSSDGFLKKRRKPPTEIK